MLYRDFMTKYRPLFAPDTEGAGGAAPAGGAAAEAAAASGADGGGNALAADGGAAAAPPADAAAAAPAEAAAAAEAPKAEPSLLEAATGKKPEGDKPADVAAVADGEKKDSPAPADAATTDAKPEADKKPEGEADAAKTDPDKKDATAEAQPPAPIAYQAFTLPEGVALDAERLKGFTDIAGPAQIPQDVAQKFMDLHVAEMKRYADDVQAQSAQHQRDVWTTLNDRWKTDLRNDPEIGGNRVDTSLSRAKAVIEEFGGTDEQIRDLIAHTSNNGMGNYPGFVRLLNTIGEKLNIFEDGMINANPSPPKPTKEAGNRGWYDKSKMGNGATPSV